MIAAARLLAAAFTVDDVHRLADISEPVLAPDGRTIAYALSTHNLAEDATASDIWSVAPAGCAAHWPRARSFQVDAHSASTGNVNQSLFILLDSDSRVRSIQSEPIAV
jgi:dipeptidyl aminopeptidase/acylaminoacyl peptidase